eukprot:GHVT01003039.1.p1 GENE.GHVT01003039.1~~GHVT01003039.1.p1  ORF type:complete len:177 (-),score=5.40 GHVT01003039.1:246-776(-)
MYIQQARKTPSHTIVKNVLGCRYVDTPRIAKKRDTSRQTTDETAEPGSVGQNAKRPVFTPKAKATAQARPPMYTCSTPPDTLTKRARADLPRDRPKPHGLICNTDLWGYPCSLRCTYTSRVVRALHARAIVCWPANFKNSKTQNKQIAAWQLPNEAVSLVSISSRVFLRQVDFPAC